ncbi:tRNA (cytidine(34)-2'-O)-methyltransferase [Jannaschia aquimarina]|uniref:tRNA (cytidine(34)-2'-O)-methyltransferase n=1 Tax=Jannaschia aquimarina TaxID=935700 RepID=A0A0D1D291_9RHOB|nr:TrmH family RNA methyltransferase [Jannaschia aquimarina]KIT14238.1 tRNA (cytidine(34)-2'-O)-methyltransferase [Jannaschia aquimarina]SNS48944.1 tRNA (cytidine/uridine-2'-O-)-methyltransferase [Jannaschia aquimarina]
MSAGPAIVLVEPLIPGNTGTIARTCAALQVDLCLVGPLGFDIADKAVKRAGLDYWPHVPLQIYDDWDDFVARRAPEALFAFEEWGEASVYDVAWPTDAHLVFGSETVGLPRRITGEATVVRLPMRSPHVRSLNLANAATAAAYIAFRALL